MVRMRMPFTQIIEPPIVGPSPFEESRQRILVMLNRPYEMSSGATLVVHGEIDQAEMTGCKLLGHEDSADLSSASPPDRLLHSLTDIARQTKDHSAPAAPA